MKKVNLTKGSIIPVLLKVALPIMGISFVQMAYNLTDIYWIGGEGPRYVAAVGIAGFFSWLSISLVILARVGTEVRVAQTTGADDEKGAEHYAATGILFVFMLGLIYTGITVLFRDQMILIFNAKDQGMNDMASQFLLVLSIPFALNFCNMLFTAIFNARGSSRSPFLINMVGLAINMVLDPLMIRGIGVPAMGVMGAAYATGIAQTIIFFIFVYKIFVKKQLFDKFHLWSSYQWEKMKEIAAMGVAPALHSAFFTVIAMIMGRMVTDFGNTAIAVQKVGTNVESLTWMTAQGISTALSAFIGQNYGAKEYGRVKSGVRAGFLIASGIGVATTLLLTIGARAVFGLFMKDPMSLKMGAEYLFILGWSQFFMCIEITGSGIFNGLGETKPPAVIGVSMNILRIPAAYFLSQTSFGLNGIWIAVALSTVLKGFLVYFYLKVRLRSKLMAV